MKVTADPTKRAQTLKERGFDLAKDPEAVFAGPTLTLLDDRRDYGEARYQTYGLLEGRLVMVAWTPRGADRHCFSMRKCNAREQKKIRHRLA